MDNMITEIKESRIQKFARLFAKAMFLLIIILTIIIMLFSLAIGQLFMAILFFLLSLLGCYLYLKNRIVRLIRIEDQMIILQDGNKQYEIRKESILYLFKFVRFTFTNHYLWAITVRNGRAIALRRYIFFNDHSHDLLKLFK